MKADLELESWMEQWQSDPTVPVQLKRKVERGSRSMRLMLAVEVLITVAMGGGWTGFAIRQRTIESAVLAGAVWTFLAAAWTFGLMNRRGNWSPDALSTTEFVALSIRRARGKLAASSFGAGLYFVEMVFCLTWLYWDPARRTPLPAVIFSVATPVFVVGLVEYRRRVRRELAGLQEWKTDQ